MVRGLPAKVTKILSRLQSPYEKLSKEFGISPELWNRLNRYANDRKTGGSTENLDVLCRDLFSLCKGGKNRIIVGSLLVKHGMRLPKKYESTYIKDLIKAGFAPEALKHWRSSALKQEAENHSWTRLGILSLCSCHRVAHAERLFCNSKLEPNSELCLAFIRAFSGVQNESKLVHWVNHLMRAKDVSEQHSNLALESLVSAKQWDTSQLLIQQMSTARHTIRTEVLSKCIAATQGEVPWPMLATMLGEHGSLLNSADFRRLIGSDIRTKVSKLLSNGSLDEAIGIVQDYEGPHTTNLCYLLLKHHLLTADQPVVVTAYPSWVEDIASQVEGSSARDSLYVHFFLTYYAGKSDTRAGMIFAQKYKLFAAAPQISGSLSYSNYIMLWKLLLKHTSSSKSSTQRSALVNLRNFAINTTSRVPLTTSLLKLMILVLNKSPDIPAIVTLMEFAADTAGVYLDNHTVQRITNDLYEYRKEDDWREKARYICAANHVEFDTAQEQSQSFRVQLQMR